MLCKSEAFSQKNCDIGTFFPDQQFDQCNNDSWVLVYEDNFNGNTLNLSRWEIQSWGQGALYGNGGASREYNTLDNAIVSDGILKIIAKKETVLRRAISWKPDDEILEDGLPNLRIYNYTSSNIWTKPKFGHGKYEAKIKIPKGKGFWPAFWTFGGNPWNEIDVFEFWNEKDSGNNYDSTKLSKVHHMTAHYDFDNDGGTNMCPSSYLGVDFSQDFHTFTMIWEKNKIEWYVDGVLKRRDCRYYTSFFQETGCTIYAWNMYFLNKIFPQDPMAIILNLAIQNGDNSPNNSTPFPSQMEIDWVKYYQRNPCQNLNITDYSQFPLNNQVYNVMVGKSVIINCNFTVLSSQQLEVVAKNNITIDPGFNAIAGSLFNARIEPTVCISTLDRDTSNDFRDTLFPGLNIKNFLPLDSVNENTDIQIFPNPNDGSFTIDFGSNDYQDFSLIISNTDGQIIYSIAVFFKSDITVNLKNNPKGIYILYLQNRKTNNAFKHKIIIQ